MSDEMMFISPEVAPVTPVMSVAQAVQRYNQTIALVSKLLKEGVDYGVIPGTQAKTLLKPGAEKLTTFFGLRPVFKLVDRIEDWDKGLFAYTYACELWHGDNMVVSSEASANSFEKRYHWRWVSEAELPPQYSDPASRDGLVSVEDTISEFQFAVKQRETGGKYGKPEEYWDRFQEAIDNKTAVVGQRKTRKGDMLPTWEIRGITYRIPNEEAPSLINTLQKMAQKRALVGSTLIAVNASEMFTQDLEDLAGVIDDVPYVVKERQSEPRAAAAQQQEEAENTWIYNRNTRAAFWATTDDLGLTHNEVHEALGVKSLKEWAGTYEGAIDKCKKWVLIQIEKEEQEDVQGFEDRQDEAEADWVKRRLTDEEEYDDQSGPF